MKASPAPSQRNFQFEGFTVEPSPSGASAEAVVVQEQFRALLRDHISGLSSLGNNSVVRHKLSRPLNITSICEYLGNPNHSAEILVNSLGADSARLLVPNGSWCISVHISGLIACSSGSTRTLFIECQTEHTGRKKFKKRSVQQPKSFEAVGAIALEFSSELTFKNSYPIPQANYFYRQLELALDQCQGNPSKIFDYQQFPLEVHGAPQVPVRGKGSLNLNVPKAIRATSSRFSQNKIALSGITVGSVVRPVGIHVLRTPGHLVQVVELSVK